MYNVDVKFIYHAKFFLIRKDFMIFLQWSMINKFKNIFNSLLNK